eukprot:263520-Rhodomonas_salina.1
MVAIPVPGTVMPGYCDTMILVVVLPIGPVVDDCGSTSLLISNWHSLLQQYPGTRVPLVPLATVPVFSLQVGVPHRRSLATMYL